MRRIFHLGLLVLMLLSLIPMSLAQDDTCYQLPATLQSDSSVQGIFEEMTTAFIYGFEASAGDVVQATMTGDSDTVDPYLVLLDSDGAVLAVNDDSDDDTRDARVEEQLTDDGTYFVLSSSYVFMEGIETVASAEQPYTVTLTDVFVPDDLADDDSIEVCAELLTYGDSVRGASTDDAPLAFYAFVGAAGDEVSIVVESPDLFSSIHLFDPTGARIAFDPSAIDVELKSDGVYLIATGDLFFYQVGTADSFFIGGEFTLTLDN